MSCLFRGEAWRGRTELAKRWLQTAVKSYEACRSGVGVKVCIFVPCLLMLSKMGPTEIQFFPVILLTGACTLARACDWLDKRPFSKKCKLVFLVAVSGKFSFKLYTGKWYFPTPPCPTPHRELWEERFSQALNYGYCFVTSSTCNVC